MLDNGSAGFRPTQWTSDGWYILYDWKEDVHALPVDPAGEPINLTASPGFESWRNDGRELVWMQVVPPATPRRAARVSEARLRRQHRPAEPPSVLPPNFTIASLVDSRARFTMTPDAQRFLIRQSDGDPRPAVQVILNWQDARPGTLISDALTETDVPTVNLMTNWQQSVPSR